MPTWGGCVVHRCQNKNPLGMWMTSCTGSACWGFWEIWKSLLSWELDSGCEGATFGSRWGQMNLRTTGAIWDGDADGKTRIERICISLPYVETFNSKVIKSFIPELRSREVFFVFRDSYVLCLYVTNILCMFPISVSGYDTHLCLKVAPTYLKRVWSGLLFNVWNLWKK